LRQFLEQAKELALYAFTDLKKWTYANPGKAVVLAVVVVFVGAAMMYFLAPAIAAELGLGVAATEVAETTAAGGLRVVVTEAAPGQVIRTGLPQRTMAKALETAGEAAKQGVMRNGVRAAKAAQQGVMRNGVQLAAKFHGVPSSPQAAAMVLQDFVATAGTALGRQAVRDFLGNAPSALSLGVGLTIAVTGRVAYAQTEGAVAATPVGPPIGIQVGEMFLLKADRPPPPPALLAAIAPPPRARPRIGQSFDAAPFSKEAADLLKPGGPATVTCRYLGRLLVS
jgi:hypothetical protein